MLSHHRLFGTLVLGLMTAFIGSAHASLVYTSGHADLGVAYEDDELYVHLHAEGAIINGVFYASGEFDADAVQIFVPTSTLENRIGNVPPILDFDPIGVGAGQPFYKLPQTNLEATTENAPFLGIGTEEIESGIFVNDQITLSVVNVSGPGYFSIFQDAVPGPNFIVSSFNGLPDSFTYSTGVHDHFNYGFTAPGVYEVTFEASGELVGGGTVTGSGTYTFVVVVPEVSTMIMSSGAMMGMMGGLWLRRRRQS